MDMNEMIQKKANIKTVSKKKKRKKKKDESYYSNTNIPFEKRFDKITTYLRHDFNMKMRKIKSKGGVKSITEFINSAVKKELEMY